MAPVVRRTWAPCGVTPVLRQRERERQKVSVIAALLVPACRTRVHCYFRCHPDANVDGARVRQFLRALTRQHPGPLTVVWDRSKPHRSRVVQAYLGAAPHVHVEPLPPYAPELNPVEYLWGHTKTNALANFAPAELEALARRTRASARSLARRPRLLRAWLQHSPLFLRLR
jgi:transposase